MTDVGGSPAIDEAGDEAGDRRPGRANRPRPKPRPEGGNRSRVTRGIEHDASTGLDIKVLSLPAPGQVILNFYLPKYKIYLKTSANSHVFKSWRPKK